MGVCMRHQPSSFRWLEAGMVVSNSHKSERYWLNYLSRAAVGCWFFICSGQHLIKHTSEMIWGSWPLND